MMKMASQVFQAISSFCQPGIVMKLQRVNGKLFTA